MVSVGAAAPEVWPEPLDRGSPPPPPQAVRTRAAPASIAALRAIREVRIGDVPPGRVTPRARRRGSSRGRRAAGPRRAGCGTQARRDEQLLQAGEQQVRDDGEQRDQDRPGDHLREVAHGQPVDDVATEPAEGDVRGDGRGRDHLQHRAADAADDQGQGVGQLDAQQHLAPAHAHAAGGVDDGGVDVAHPGVGAGEDRRHGEDHQRGDRAEQAQPGGARRSGRAGPASAGHAARSPARRRGSRRGRCARSTRRPAPRSPARSAASARRSRGARRAGPGCPGDPVQCAGSSR